MSQEKSPSRSPVRATVFNESEVHFGVGKRQAQRLLLASHKTGPVLKEVLDEQHPSFKKFLKGKSNQYQTSNP